MIKYSAQIDRWKNENRKKITNFRVSSLLILLAKIWIQQNNQRNKKIEQN